MTDHNDDISGKHAHYGSASRQPLVVRVIDSDSRRSAGKAGTPASQNGHARGKRTARTCVKLAEDRITLLERSEIRRSVHDRIVNAVITVAISAAIALHDRWGIK
jgi:hypothetical protein